MKIAIIGAGISGLTAAYVLSERHQVSVFEKAERIGGHTATMDVHIDGQDYAIDTGFIVYNDWTYPNFIRLLNKIGVANQCTSMGFSVSCEQTGLEYAGNNIPSLFAQKRNLFSSAFLGMLRDIVRFNREAKQDLANNSIGQDISLGEYLTERGYSDMFIHYYLVPMGAAIWSASFASIKNFPLLFFVRFFSNHGLLNIGDRPQWRVIKGGSKTYLGPLTKPFAENIHVKAGINQVLRLDKGVKIIFDNGDVKWFDEVIIATHSDEALELLGDASEDEQAVLGDIPYEENDVVLHYDESLLPKRKRAWSSWNYRMQGADQERPVLTYNMNILQGIKAKKTFCVTLNATDKIDPNKILGRYRYAHPQFSLAGIRAQDRWSLINGVNHTWFCGAYWRNGFHEDGVVSALNVTEALGVFL